MRTCFRWSKFTSRFLAGRVPTRFLPFLRGYWLGLGLPSAYAARFWSARRARRCPGSRRRGAGACPMYTPRGGGRSTRGEGAARAREDPALGTRRRRGGTHCTPARSLRVRRVAARQSPTRPCPTASATCTPDRRGAAARPVAATRAHEDPAPGNGDTRVRHAPPACSSRCAGADPHHP